MIWADTSIPNREFKNQWQSLNLRTTGRSRRKTTLVVDISRTQWKCGEKYSVTISPHMDNQPTTAELTVSKAKDEIIKEAKRIEEALLFSSKKHFKAASLWSGFHLCIGIPIVLVSGLAGATAFAQFDVNHVIAGVLSLVIAGLSSVMTFLNPNAKAASHQMSVKNTKSRMKDVRRFWSFTVGR